MNCLFVCFAYAVIVALGLLAVLAAVLVFQTFKTVFCSSPPPEAKPEPVTVNSRVEEEVKFKKTIRDARSRPEYICGLVADLGRVTQAIVRTPKDNEAQVAVLILLAAEAQYLAETLDAGVQV